MAIKRIEADLIIDTDELEEQIKVMYDMYGEDVEGIINLLEEIQDQCAGSSHASEGKPINEQ